MLKNIPAVLSPELLSVLLRMGHGDDLVIADGHFPAESCGQRVIRADGLSVAALLDAILYLFPLDTFVDDPVKVMQPVDAATPEPPVWNTYREIVARRERPMTLQPIERFQFYELTKSAFAVVATSDTAVYANILLKKGIARGLVEESSAG